MRDLLKLFEADDGEGGGSESVLAGVLCRAGLALGGGGASGMGGVGAIGGELFSDAMGEPGTPKGTYEGMVRHNVDAIVKALRE